MGSQLSTIYSTLAGLDVTIPGTTPIVVGALGLSRLPETVDSHRMPTRLIIPTAGRGTGQTMRPRTFKAQGDPGVVLTIDWRITDLLLYRASDAGLGLAEIAPILVAYTGAYLSLVGALRFNTWAVTDIQFPSIGSFEWPAQSGRWFDGVETQLTIREIVPSGRS